MLAPLVLGGALLLWFALADRSGGASGGGAAIRHGIELPSELHPNRRRVIEVAMGEIGRGAGGDHLRYVESAAGELPTPPRKVEWCGIFLLWALHEAGLMRSVKWEWGRGFLYRLPLTRDPKPGDFGYKDRFNHQNMIVARDGDTLWTVDGNGWGGVVTGPNRQNIHDFQAFYSMAPLAESMTT